MNKVLRKLSFAIHITAGIPSLLRLLWHSKKLRWSKTGFIKPHTRQAQCSISIEHTLGKRQLYLRTYVGDIDIFYEVFFKKIYALPASVAKGIKTIVDLGANVGLSAIYFLQQYPQAYIVCVEPDESNFEMLTKNLQPEIASGKVKAMNVAAMGEDGFVSFESADAKYNSRVVPQGIEKNIAAVSIPTLMQHCGIDRVNLLKIDVEGAEKYILSGDTAWLRKVDNILIELHSDEDHAVCMQAFQQYNFKVEALHGDAANEQLFWASRPA
jgi:FkbM family methyltransferase